MAVIIKGMSAISDPWQRLERAGDGGVPRLPATGDVIVPLAWWQGKREELLARPGRLGVWLMSDEEPSAIAEDLRLLDLVAVNFPKATDGRGYSIACLLRQRYGFRGELRAFGDIWRDQLFFLASCGFNSFALREGEDPQEALGAFGEFSEPYQGSAARPLPLFRRRRLPRPEGTGSPQS